MLARCVRPGSFLAVTMFAASLLVTYPVFAQLPAATLTVGLPVGTVPVLEHSTIAVPFSLDVEPHGKPRRRPIDLAVCAKNSLQCVSFPGITPPWRSPSGSKLTMNAPAAGQKMPLDLVACVAARNADSVVSCGTTLSEDTSSSIDVSMHFVISVDSFTILHTRAQSKDTTFYFLAGISNGQPVPVFNKCATNLAGFISPLFCAGPLGIGDLGDGTYPVNQIRVGEFEWVPGRANNVTFAFATINYGSHLLLPQLPGDMRSKTMDVLLNKLTAPNSGVLEDFTPEVNDLDGWTGCDGPTAAGAKRIFNFHDQSQQEPTVDELTRDTGQFSTPSKIFVVPSQDGCGASSKYQIKWTLFRTSWQSF